MDLGSLDDLAIPTPATFAAIDLSVMTASIEASIAEGQAECARIEAEVLRIATDPATIAEMADGAGGAVHAASLQTWIALAERAGVPYVPAEIVARIAIRDAWDSIEGRIEDLDPRGDEIMNAVRYAAGGGYWRTDLCASSDVKWQLSQSGTFEVPDHFALDDPRIMDMHWGMSEILILGRPIMSPVLVDGWPVEFRVFIGGEAQEDGAVSFYYPQVGDAAERAAGTDPRLQEAAAQAREWALSMTALRERLGLLPFLPGRDFAPDARIGATIDFMLTEERGLVMIDAGPGFGFGAHPCCFIDSSVTGTRWRLADGVEAR